MGFHDSMRALKNDAADERIEARIEGDEVVISGKTYRHKDFLKHELRETNMHWDRDTQSWRIKIATMMSGSVGLMDEVFGLTGIHGYKGEGETYQRKPSFC